MEGSRRREAACVRQGGGELVNRGESFQKNLLNNPVGRQETILQTFLVDHVE